MTTDYQIRMATIADLDALVTVGDALFDYPIKPASAKKFFADPRHHLFIALADGNVVGMASAFDYLHPDKELALFVNEVAVLEAHQNKGIARALVKRLVEYGREIGCEEIWIATEVENHAARKAFSAAGGKEDKDLAVVYTFDSDNA